jgi:GAF domain-containing protein
VGADGTVQARGRGLPTQRIGLPTDSYTVVPVRWAGQVVGYFRVVTSTRVVRPTAEQLRVAVLLADRMAGVYDWAISTGSPTPR